MIDQHSPALPRFAGGKEGKAQILGGELLFCYVFICVAWIFLRFQGTAFGSTQGESSMATWCAGMWGEPAPGAWLYFGMEMMILIKQLCWEEGSGLSGCWTLETRDAAGPWDEGCSMSEGSRAGPAWSQSTDHSIHAGWV